MELSELAIIANLLGNSLTPQEQQQLKKLREKKKKKKPLSTREQKEYKRLRDKANGILRLGKILNINVQLLAKALLGQTLTRQERIYLEGAYKDLQRDEKKLQKWHIDYDEIESYIEGMDEATQFIQDTELGGIFRYAVAHGDVDTNFVDHNEHQPGYYLFNDLSYHQVEPLLRWLRETGESADVFLSKYLEDFFSGAWFARTTETSQFWAWYREIFYS